MSRRIREAIADFWGNRCDPPMLNDPDAVCECCEAWRQYDLMVEAIRVQSQLTWDNEVLRTEKEHLLKQFNAMAERLIETEELRRDAWGRLYWISCGEYLDGKPPIAEDEGDDE